MRVVVDTNVLISGIFFGGLPGRILSAWTAGRFDLVLSPDVLEEYRRVGEDLARDRRGLVASLEAMLALITTHALLVAAPALPDRVCRDPDDDKFLAVALASGTKLIVSGDQDLLAVSGWRGVTVLRPRAFADQYLRSV